MKIKVSEATRLQINWMVSTLTNPEWDDEDRAQNTYDYVDIGDEDDELYMPTEDWAQGGPIIERECIQTWKDDCSTEWLASAFGDSSMDRAGVYDSGPTPLIAAMRCYVASKLGDEVEVPDELSPTAI